MTLIYLSHEEDKFKNGNMFPKQNIMEEVTKVASTEEIKDTLKN